MYTNQINISLSISPCNLLVQELAGRTMEFTFDVSQTPLIGRRILLKSETESTGPSNRNNGQNSHLAQFNTSSGTPNSPRRSASLSPADTAPLSGWKRPWMSQSRVRECLVNLLTTCGQRVGLPKSPSVSFLCHISSYYTIYMLETFQ